MVKKNNLFLLVLVFLSFLFLRTWLLPKTIPFGWDQERDAKIISKIIQGQSLPLIGPRVVGDNGFYLGPYFFYLLLPFYALTSLNPIAIVYFVIFVAIVFFVTTYFSFEKNFTQKIALIYLFIWGVLPLTVNIDRIAWNPLLIPLCFSVIILMLKNKKNVYLYYLILGFILGVTLHLHFQGIFYSIFTLAYIYKENKKDLKNIPFILLGFLVSFTPLIIFDLRHSFINSHLLVNFFFSPSSTPRSLLSFVPVWVNFIGKLSGINNYIFAILIWLLLLIYAFLRRKTPFFFASTVIILITPIAFALYGRRPSEYYFTYLLPIIVLFVSFVLSRINLSSFIFTIVIVLSSYFSFGQIKEDSLSLFYKDQIVREAKTILRDQPVYVTYDTPLGQNNGFDYLIFYHRINRSEDSTRPGVQFIIPRRDSLPSSGNISLFIPEL